MELPLVVGIDGSDGSLLAIDWAVDEAARHGMPLRLVYASLWERYEGTVPTTNLRRPSEQVMAEHIVASAAERARRRNPDVKLSTETIRSEAVSALLSEGNNASLLVTGSRGRGELKGLLLGSVGLAVAARAYCPVIVVRGDAAGLAGTHERILLGAGDASTSGEARGGVLDVVRSWRCPAHESTDHPLMAGEPARLHEERAVEILETALRDAAADHPSVKLRRRTAEGPARTVLLDAAAEADLLVVGALRREGHFGLQLGRVAHALLHHSACPVAVVPHHA